MTVHFQTYLEIILVQMLIKQKTPLSYMPKPMLEIFDRKLLTANLEMPCTL